MTLTPAVFHSVPLQVEPVALTLDLRTQADTANLYFDEVRSSPG